MKNIIAGGIVVLVFSFTVFDGGETGVAAFIREYQTLITGILAVIAAYFTIGQMRVSEAEQGKRHNQLLELSTRKETLRIKRAYEPQVSELRLAQTHLEYFSEAFRAQEDHPSHSSAIKERKTLIKSIYSVAAIYNREQILEIKDLFDDVAIRALQMGQGHAEGLRLFAQRMQDADDASEHTDEPWYHFQEWWTEHEISINNSFEMLISCNNKLIRQLEDLYRQSHPTDS